jgi:GH15 family glucan-1,4-alpha-glucosidase
MPRHLCFGNGDFLLDFDKNFSIRDLLFPLIGKENHVKGNHCRLGVWIDGEFSWINNAWKRELKYKTDTLVGEVILEDPKQQVEIRIECCIHHFYDIFLRQIKVRNKTGEKKEVRLFFSFDFHINETDSGITAFYHPDFDAVVTYRHDVFFLVSGASQSAGMYEFSVGMSADKDLDQIWEDAKGGNLNNNLVSHGSVESAISLREKFAGNQERTFYSWLAAGRSLYEVSRLNSLVKEKGMQRLIAEAEEYSKAWLTSNKIDLDGLPPRIINLFKRSLLLLRTQIDNRGGIIASSDSEILKYNDDTYNYVWPRDGAFAAMSLDAVGYFEISQRFFSFCSNIVSAEGFLYQKYNSDGSWGSNWHPWSNSKLKTVLPIQEDATALVICALWNHFERSGQIEFIKPLYYPLICKTADFMTRYRDPINKLPMPSYDLWEEHLGVSTFTTSAVFGALKASSFFAHQFGDVEKEKIYQKAAEEIKTALISHLYDKGKNRFIKMLKVNDDGSFIEDSTIDSSLFGVFKFGVLPVQDIHVQNTMKAVEAALWVQTDVGGMARFENDTFHKVKQTSKNVSGNPWIICTLRLAQWYIFNRNLSKGLELINWVVERSLESGILSEQVDPFNNEPLSVSPLTWSHSTFIATVMEYLEAKRGLKCP